MSIGPAVGGLLAGVSFEWLFAIDGITSVIAGIGLVLAGSRLALSPTQLEHEARKKKSRSSSSAAWKDMRFVYFMIAIIPVTFVFFQHISSMPLYLVRDLHLSPAQYGLMFTINTLLIVFLEVPLNLSTIHWTHRRNLMVGSALFAIGFGGLAFSVGFWSVTATVVIWTFGEMILFPGSSAYVSHLAPPERQGEYMGFYSMSFALAFMFAPWVGTQILQNKGGVSLWGVMFALGMLSTLLMSRIKNGKREETANEVMVETEFSA
jgi:MFS family permease